MAFNTNSFLAGVGAVVAVLSTGVAGGYFLTTPSHIDPPNRLQRVAAANQEANPAPVTAATKPEIVAAVTPTAAAAEQAAPPAAPAIAAPAAPPARTAAIQEAAAPATAAKPDTDTKTNVEKANADKARAAETRNADARAIEKKRIETRKTAEQQRKQRELEVATIAVRRIIHGRDAPDVVVDSDQTEAPAAEMPHFNLFGQ